MIPLPRANRNLPRRRAASLRASLVRRLPSHHYSPMKFDDDIFECIRIKPDPDAVARRSFPRCDWEGCEAAGSHPAPKGRGHEGEYHRFCIDHVRLYNKSYNYFSGLADEAVASFQKDAATGHRPTWTMGSNPDAGGPKPRGEDFEIPKNWTRRSGDPRIQFGRAARFRPEFRSPPVRRKPLEKKALETLDLPETAAGDVIRARYKELVKRHHPDANGGDRSSEGRLQEIIHAYKLLRAAGLA